MSDNPNYQKDIDKNIGSAPASDRAGDFAQRRRNARDAGRHFHDDLALADADYAEKSPLLSQTTKGIIGMLVALALVMLVILFFAKVLFLHDANVSAKTGTITVTLPTGTTVATTTGIEHQAKTTKERVRYNVDSKTATGENGEAAAIQRIKCISAVLVHPKPNSKSGDIGTIPTGTVVDLIKDENGWYLIKYNNITGYAWNQFFETAKVTTAAQN